MAAPVEVVLLVSVEDQFPPNTIKPRLCAESADHCALFQGPPLCADQCAVVRRKSFNESFMNNTSSSSHLLLFSGAHSKRSIFICVHLRGSEDDDGEDDEDEGALKIYTSFLFLSRHRLAERSRGTARLLPALPTVPSLETSGVSPLQRVVLAACSGPVLRWASSQRFSRLLQALLSSSWVLAREGDPLLLPCSSSPPPPHSLPGEDPAQFQEYLQQLLVLQCLPVSQGALTADTVVVVTDYEVPPPAAVTSSVGAVTSSEGVAGTWSVFASDFAHFSSSALGDAVLMEWQVEVQVLTRCLDADGDGHLDGDRRVDGDSCVFVTKQLLLRLGLFNREWILLLQGTKQRPAQVVVVPEDPWLPWRRREDAAFITSTLWFNLTNGQPLPVNLTNEHPLPAHSAPLKMKRWKPGRVRRGGDTYRSDSECLSVRPPVAKELHVQPVLCPRCKQHGCYDDLLQQYFTVPRLVREGDILTVPVQHCPDLIQHNTDGINWCAVVHFRVQRVVGAQEEEEKTFRSHEEEPNRAAFLADTQNSTLYMGASTNSMSPWCSVDQDSSSLFFNSVRPPGLTSAVDALTSVITPSLTHSGVCACTVLLQGPRAGGKTTAVRAACRGLHLHLLKADCVSVCGETAAACEQRLRALFQRASNQQPCVLLLRNLRLLAPAGSQDGPPGDSRVWGTLCELINNLPHSVVVIATVSSPRELCPDVVQLFVHQVSVSSPGEEERRGMLESLSKPLPLGGDVSLSLLAKQTAGLVLGDLCALLTEAGRAAHRRLSASGPSLHQEQLLCSSGVSLHSEDFCTALDTLQGALSSAVGAPKVPSVHWEDVGGLAEVKQQLMDTVRLPLDRPEMFSSSVLGLRRTGLLLYGPPGTGKTLLAKAVATETNMTFLSVKGPELLNMYVGQSEENVREVFSKARAAAPCIVFFDELDSLAPNRGRSGDSGGVMDRVVSQLLSELDSLGSSEGLFVIGATNRPDLLDQSLLRPGRFDKLVYVGINEDKQSQLQVLKAIARKFQCDPSVDLSEVVSRCPAHLTGADLYALCSDAMATAVNRKISSILDGVDTEDSPVVLSLQDFDRAVQQCKPSVSEQEMQRYQQLHRSLTTQ